MDNTTCKRLLTFTFAHAQSIVYGNSDYQVASFSFSVYVWIGVNVMLGDHRLRVDRNFIDVYERKRVLVDGA